MRFWPKCFSFVVPQTWTANSKTSLQRDIHRGTQKEFKRHFYSLASPSALAIGCIGQRPIHQLSVLSCRLGKSDTVIAEVVDGVIGYNRARSHFEKE